MQYADFSAGTCLIFPTQKAGHSLKVFTNAMVREVLTNDEGKATGVSYINREDRKEYAIRGKIVILAASACSTARILLNSKTSRFSNGLGNGSGMIGRYLHDSTGASRSAIVPELFNRKTYNEDGVAVCMFTLHGGWTTKNLIFLVAIIWKFGRTRNAFLWLRV